MLLATAGCIVDGRYHVRGTVRGDGAGRAPIAGATATVRQCVPREDPAETKTTDVEGRYDVRCAFGGMCFLFWCPGVRVPDTTVEFAAPGRAPLAVRLLDEGSDARVSRSRCDSTGPESCFQLDVALEAAGGR